MTIHVPSLEKINSFPPPKVSFEFFPPKTDDMEQSLWEAIKELAPIQPHFVSVTYGAGGSTRERTHATIKRILDDTNLKPAAHLTCVGAPKSEINEILQDYWQIGVRHIVALRGDALKGVAHYQPHPEGYAYATDLVAGIKSIADFEISVAAYPERHPESETIEADIEYLKMKVDAGATRAITQFFFNTDAYFRYVEKVQAAGIDIPIVPGILPVTHFKRAVEFSKKCGTSVPTWMADLFEGLDNAPMRRNLVSMAVAIEQCNILRAAGVEEFHFYTLNRASLTRAICHILGVRPPQEEATS